LRGKQGQGANASPRQNNTGVAFADKPLNAKFFIYVCGEDMKKSQTVWIKPGIAGRHGVVEPCCGSMPARYRWPGWPPIAEIREELKSVPPDIRATMSREQ